FYHGFGLLIPLACIAVALYALTCKGQRALPFVLLVGTALGVAGFVQVQGMGPHHYYLLMPALSAGAAASVILLARRIGSRLTLIALCVLFFFLALAPRYGGVFNAVQPADVYLRPKSDGDVVELIRLGWWLTDNVKSDERYCVAASSMEVNDSRVANIWQLDGRLAGGIAQTRI